MKSDLLFTGDVFLRSANGTDPFTEDIVTLFSSAEKVCIDLETAVCRGTNPAAKMFVFNADISQLKSAIRQGVEVFNVANNHSLDYGNEGFKETINNILDNNASVIGAIGNNETILCLKNGVRVALFAYHGPNNGQLSHLSKDRVIKDIEKVKNGGLADIVIICLHWGEEYVPIPSPKQQKLSHLFIDAGADIIIGHHPHVMQGVECYKSKLIFYSLGNFNIFVDHPYSKDLTETTKSYAVSLSFNPLKDKIDICYKLIPITINDNWQPMIMHKIEDIERHKQYIDIISKPLDNRIRSIDYYAIAGPRFFKNHFYSWCERVKKYGLKQIVYMIEWFFLPNTLKHFIGLLLSPLFKQGQYEY